jgi:hypothetical protein
VDAERRSADTRTKILEVAEREFAARSSATAGSKRAWSGCSTA